MIGVGLSRQLGWKTDLKNPQLEVKLFTLLKIFLVVLICCYNKSILLLWMILLYIAHCIIVYMSVFSSVTSQVVCSFLQVNIYLSDDHCLMGIALTRLLTNTLYPFTPYY